MRRSSSAAAADDAQRRGAAGGLGVLGLAVGEGGTEERTRGRRRRRASAALSFGGEGKTVHTEVRWPPIRLQVGHGRRLTYKMTYFKQVQNCNGTSAVT
jgi:hypothetical protein